MLVGVKEMDKVICIYEIKGNFFVLLVLSWYVAGKGYGEKDMVVIFYKDSLLLLSCYL